MTTAREVRVHGRVQGVFFRDSCRAEARSRAVGGWVRNEADGSVSAWFEGEDEDVAALVAWCGSGPAYARVDRVEVTERDPHGIDGFEVR
jgi:acylphosphatase